MFICLFYTFESVLPVVAVLIFVSCVKLLVGVILTAVDPEGVGDVVVLVVEAVVTFEVPLFVSGFMLAVFVDGLDETTVPSFDLDPPMTPKPHNKPNVNRAKTTNPIKAHSHVGQPLDTEPDEFPAPANEE